MGVMRRFFSTYPDEYDNVFISHADRSRFVGAGARDVLTYRTGPIPGALLVDGRMVGAWHIRNDAGRATVVLDNGDRVLVNKVSYQVHDVRRGDVVGYAGSTGWSTGCHLHFTVLRDGTPVDPMGYM